MKYLNRRTRMILISSSYYFTYFVNLFFSNKYVIIDHDKMCGKIWWNDRKVERGGKVRIEEKKRWISWVNIE